TPSDPNTTPPSVRPALPRFHILLRSVVTAQQTPLEQEGSILDLCSSVKCRSFTDSCPSRRGLHVTVHVTGGTLPNMPPGGCGWVADLRMACANLPLCANEERPICSEVNDLGSFLISFQDRHVRPLRHPSKPACSTRRQSYCSGFYRRILS